MSSLPHFSWDTIPVFYHSCNFTGPFTNDALDIISRFSLVTIEKGQGVLAENTLDALRDGDADLRRRSEPEFADDRIVDALQHVKSRNPRTTTIFYYNSLLDWPPYRLHDVFLTKPDLWLRDKDGQPCRTDGDPSFPDHLGLLSFDFTNPSARELWIQTCINATKTGFVGGCFSDRSVDNPRKCALANLTAYEVGHRLVHQELQAALDKEAHDSQRDGHGSVWGGGSQGVLIANKGCDLPGVGGAMIEFFRADEQSIKLLRRCVGKIVQVRAVLGEDGRDAHLGTSASGGDNIGSSGITDSLAAFLIGAGVQSYYAASRGWKVQVDPVTEAWRPEYDRPLGVPESAAMLDELTGVYRRTFQSRAGRTVVTFDTRANRGTITWADVENRQEATRRIGGALVLVLTFVLATILTLLRNGRGGSRTLCTRTSLQLSARRLLPWLKLGGAKKMKMNQKNSDVDDAEGAEATAKLLGE